MPVLKLAFCTYQVYCLCISKEALKKGVRMIIIYFLISFLVIGCSPPLDLLSVNVIYDWNDIIKKYNITGIECSAPDDSANRQWLDYNKNILFNTLVYNYRKLNVYRTTDGYYR